MIKQIKEFFKRWGIEIFLVTTAISAIAMAILEICIEKRFPYIVAGAIAWGGIMCLLTSIGEKNSKKNDEPQIEE